jgi:hypothetical protein
MVVLGFLVVHPALCSAAEFSRLDLEHAVSALTMTEDGRHVVVAHKADDRLSVVDTQTGRLVKQLPSPQPSFVISRGTKLFRRQRRERHDWRLQRCEGLGQRKADQAGLFQPGNRQHDRTPP